MNDSMDIMYYANIPGPVNAANRFHLFSSADAVTGGDYLVTKSTLVTTCNGVGAMIPSTALNCSAIAGINELFNNDIELIVYPNPADDYLNLSFKLNRNANIKVALYDYIGKQIKIINKDNQYIGSHTIQLNVADISAGFYILRMKINNREETVKLIIK